MVGRLEDLVTGAFRGPDRPRSPRIRSRAGGTIPIAGSGSFYQPASGSDVARLAPGDRLSLRVALADGRSLESETVVPGAFELAGLASS